MDNPIAIERGTMEAIADAIRIRTEQGGGGGGGGGALIIRVTAPTGSKIIAEKDGITYTAQEESGMWNIEVPDYGVYTVTATLGDDTAVVAVDVNPSTISISYTPQVYGVMWNSSNSSTELTRLTSDNDDNQFVNTNITETPKVAVGNDGGSSPFDVLLPWRDMEQYNIIDNAIGFKRGQVGFSQTENDTVVYIPEFYYKVILSGNYKYFYICDRPRDGFEKHPGSGRYVGRYNTGEGYVSKSALLPLVNIKRSDSRTGSHNKGNNWWQYDYATWCAIWLLYLVEYANWDSQKTIGRGIVDSNTSAFSSGGTDAMVYHTGRAEGVDGQTAVQYRWIENPWGNVLDWVDGINFQNRQALISLDNANFKDDTNSGYTSTGITLPNSQWITNIGLSSAYNWAFLPSAASGGSDSTYIPDYVYIGGNWCLLAVGGDWTYASSAGLFDFRGDYASSRAGAYLGARLLFIP